MNVQKFRSAALVREDIKIQEITVQEAKDALTDLLGPMRLAKSLGDRIRGLEGSILQMVVDPEKGESVLKLGAKLGVARADFRAVEMQLPRRELIERAEERVHVSVRYLGKLRNELAEAEGREAVDAVRRGTATAAK